MLNVHFFLYAFPHLDQFKHRSDTILKMISSKIQSFLKKFYSRIWKTFNKSNSYEILMKIAIV